MNITLRNSENSHSIIGLAASGLLHIVLISAALLAILLSSEKPKVNPRFVELMPAVVQPAGAKNISTKTEEKKEISPQPGERSYYYSFARAKADTSSLVQVYSEPTLRVRLKYPNGWTYIDQDIKNKLDGVTFWAANSNISPPPYVHLEVKDKDIFNPKRFKYKDRINDYTVYYNDPEELEEQVSQVFYFRTETDEDFSMKLIIKGRENFKIFQPQFFGMLKTFRFGNFIF